MTQRQQPPPRREGIPNGVMRTPASKEDPPTPEVQLRRARETIEELWERDYMIYTDGSAEGGVADGGAGVAVIGARRRGGWGMSGASGSILQFLCSGGSRHAGGPWLAGEKPGVEESCGLTGSQALLAALEGCSTQTRVSKLRDALWRLEGEGRNLVLVWVPGHCGLPGNKRAAVELWLLTLDLPRCLGLELCSCRALLFCLVFDCRMGCVNLSLLVKVSVLLKLQSIAFFSRLAARCFFLFFDYFSSIFPFPGT